MPAAPKDPDDLTSPLGPEAASQLKGDAFGRVYPGPVSPPFDQRDAREHALETFADFVAALRFTRTGDVPDGPPLKFMVPREQIHVFQPDDVQQHPLTTGGLGILPGRARHEAYGLGPSHVLDETADCFGLGLVLVRHSDHVETVALELFAATQPERRGIISGLKQALRMDDRSGALRLVCRKYFGVVASFRLDESESIDDEGATLNRRRAHLFVLLQVPEVQLVAYRKTKVGFEVVTERGTVSG